MKKYLECEKLFDRVAIIKIKMRFPLKRIQLEELDFKHKMLKDYLKSGIIKKKTYFKESEKMIKKLEAIIK